MNNLHDVEIIHKLIVNFIELESKLSDTYYQVSNGYLVGDLLLEEMKPQLKEMRYKLVKAAKAVENDEQNG